MPREGRFLEILIGHLQEFFGPEGIQVKSPEIFFDDSGKKIGEVDVTLRSNVGTSTTFIGIECRDRPGGQLKQTGHRRKRNQSQKQENIRPQGRDWIREIQGKKEDLHVQKMVAVSSTGFTQEAIDLARQFDIDLLYVTSANEPETKDWFQTLIIGWQEEIYEIKPGINIETVPRTAKLDLSIGRNVPFIKMSGNEASISLAQLIENHLDALFSQLPSRPGAVEQLTSLEIDGPMDATINEKQFKVARINIPLKLTRENVEAKVAVDICKSLSIDKIIALSGTCKVQTSIRELRVLVLAKKSKSQSDKIDLRCICLTPDNEPYLLPAGTKIALYGKH